MLFKVALLQIESKSMEVAENLKKGMTFCRKAVELGADLCLFPEGWNIGYDLEYLYGLINNNQLDDITKNKLSIETTEFVQAYCQIAKELNVAIGITYISCNDGIFKNNISIIDRKGSIQFTYSKVHTCQFGFESIVEPGQEFFVCNLDSSKGNVKIGAMICFDREFPESARILMLKGAEIILVPNYSKMDKHRLSQLNSRAFENMLGIAMCNAPGDKHGHSAAYDGIAFYDTEEPKEMLLVEAGETEGLFIAGFEIDELRKYRKTEVWGNAFRRQNCYKELLDSKIEEPFLRLK